MQQVAKNKGLFFLSVRRSECERWPSQCSYVLLRQLFSNTSNALEVLSLSLLSQEHFRHWGLNTDLGFTWCSPHRSHHYVVALTCIYRATYQQAEPFAMPTITVRTCFQGGKKNTNTIKPHPAPPFQLNDSLKPFFASLIISISPVLWAACFQSYKKHQQRILRCQNSLGTEIISLETNCFLQSKC